MTQWSPGQEHALRDVAAWLAQCRSELAAGRRLSRPIYRMFGYAGTGKTTLAKTLAGDLQKVCFAAFTGKAALMMQRNGCTGATTIHGLIYQVVELPNGGTKFVWDADSAAVSADLICLDEASMIDEDMAGDMLRYGRPILVLGDPAQLPPVKGTGYFTEARPDVMLTEVHRQAAESPILRLATMARLGQQIDLGEYGDGVRVVPRGTLTAREVSDSGAQVIVGKNATRTGMNNRLRNVTGKDSVFPVFGDRLVCLKNDKAAGIFNGGLFQVTEASDGRASIVHMEVTSDDFPNLPPIEVKALRQCFTGGLDDLPWQDRKGYQEFDYGYVLTAHKSQGSQWDGVIVYDESGVFRDDRHRWLYTAITRAATRLTVVK